MAKIVWTKKAKTQLEKSVKYIDEIQGRYYAEIVLNGIIKSIELLEKSPEIGTKEPLLLYKKFEYRFIVKWSFKIIYRITKDNEIVYISRIFQTSQHPSKLW